MIQQQNKNETKKGIPVGSIATKFLLVDVARKKLDVAPATLDILFKLNRVLDHQSAVFVAELRKFCRYGKMPGICSCLDA